jgi:hypothetical protein
MTKGKRGQATSPIPPTTGLPVPDESHQLPETNPAGKGKALLVRFVSCTTNLTSRERQRAGE